MTDRGKTALRQSADTFIVGPSSLHWDGAQLIIDVDEIGSPPRVGCVRGQITVTPRGVTDVELPLTSDGAHVWRPFAPTSDIKVDLGGDWTWNGHGYFDANFGTRALEQDFTKWNWARFPTSSGSTCFYDAKRIDGSTLATGFAFDENGLISPADIPPKTRFRRSAWLVARETRADAGYTPKQVKPMLDAPFYCRSAIRTQINGEETVGVHESLDLVRFRSPLLKPMLAVRVPRRRKWVFRN